MITHSADLRMVGRSGKADQLCTQGRACLLNADRKGVSWKHVHVCHVLQQILGQLLACSMANIMCEAGQRGM